MVIKHMLLLQSVVGIVLVFVVGAGIVSYSLLRRKGLQEHNGFFSDGRGLLAKTNTTKLCYHDRPRETLRETLRRLRTLFRLGWFFEWPGGRHPLNTTWPWADVKPSLVVLWGVCWMFAIDPRRRVNALSNDRYYAPPNHHQVARNTHQVQHPPQYSHRPHRPDPNMHPMNQQSWHELSGFRRFEPSHRFDTANNPVVKIEYGEPRYFPAPTPGDRTDEALYALPHNQQSTARTRLVTQPSNHRRLYQAAITAPPNPIRIMADSSAEDFSNYAALPGDFSEGTSTYNNDAKPLEPTSIHHQLSRLNDPDRRNQYRHYPDQVPRYHSAFQSDYPPNFYTSIPTTMSLSYESRSYPVEYPQSALMQHDPHEQQDDNMQRYPSPPPMGENPYGHQNIDAATALNIGEEMPELPQKEESDAPSPGRSKPIPKPDREVTKGDDGRFVCTWAGCTEEVRSFNRKCEWSKHMDKHDRPYKCPAEGCEKLPGFTYSGGLLRHQREVHNLHGGPRKQLNCPHPNCKRYSGKGFSRQENLNEHLRRVHTDGAGEIQDGAETEEETSERAGMKRKRTTVESPDLRQEVAKLRKENETLKRQAEQQSQHMNELSRQVQTLQSIVGVHALPQGPPQQAPPAQMTNNQGMRFTSPSPLPM